MRPDDLDDVSENDDEPSARATDDGDLEAIDPLMEQDLEDADSPFDGDPDGPDGAFLGDFEPDDSDEEELDDAEFDDEFEMSLLHDLGVDLDDLDSGPSVTAATDAAAPGQEETEDDSFAA